MKNGMKDWQKTGSGADGGSKGMEKKQKVFKVGILGAGNIAGSMAKALNGLAKAGEIVPWAVASRSLQKSESFAEEWNFERAYGSYEELAADEELDLIYIATPHSLHFEHAALCIGQGRNVLVEKAFTANARQAEQLFQMAAEKKVFLAEAMWTRYMPSRQMITKLLEEGAIGEVQRLEAVFSVPNYEKPRMHEPELCGGALLDLGVYVLTSASIYMGDNVIRTESHCKLYETGVDATDDIILTYPGEKKAILHTSMMEEKSNFVRITGSEGSLFWESNNNPRNVVLYSREGMVQRKIELPVQINGYEYEVEACRRAIQAGQKECPEMPHGETMVIMRQMDALRKEWGIRYPFE